MYTYLSSNWLQENDATHPTYLSGPMDTQKSRYSSPVDHRSLNDLCTSTYTMSQKLCARYTLGARYLYFKRNVEKFWGAYYTLGSRYRSENTVHNM